MAKLVREDGAQHSAFQHGPTACHRVQPRYGLESVPDEPDQIIRSEVGRASL